MFRDLADFYSGAEDLFQAFEKFVEQSKLQGSAVADHLCYKCSSSEEFEGIRALFEVESDFVYQSIISERRIAVIRLKKEFTTTLGPIRYLELSDQKPDGSQKNKFDHIEIYPQGAQYKDLASIIAEKGFVVQKVARPHHTTYDLTIDKGFLVRIEPEALIEKIQREEMK